VEGAVSVDPRTPVLIGVAQRTWHLSGEEWSPEPLEMAAEVLAGACADASAPSDVGAAIDGLDMVHCMSWDYDDPPGRVAERVGLSPTRRHYSGLGGTVPLQLLGAAAARIVAGESDVEAVVGAEALDTKRRLKKVGRKPDWSHRNPQRRGFPLEAPFHPAEVAHEVFQAWLTFAVRDVARRARTNVEPGEHRRRLGELLAPMSEVAADNPHAWFPRAYTPQDLFTPTAENRMVGYPYTKRMVSVMDVDMAAAMVVASCEAADRLGVPVDRRVPVRGWAYATDATYVAEHPDLSRSPAMAVASAEAFRLAGVGLPEIAHLDLYSCFASSVDFARDAVGLAPDDPRSTTVTGGLPYAGGPASNYTTHAVASMVERLREEPARVGLVSGVGMHMTKHAWTVLGGPPDSVSPAVPDAESLQERLDADHPVRRITDVVVGGDVRASVAAYSVVHGRDGVAGWGLAVCDLPDGSRCYARTDEPALLAAWETEEWVGRDVTLRADGEVNRLRV